MTQARTVGATFTLIPPTLIPQYQVTPYCTGGIDISILPDLLVPTPAYPLDTG